MFVLTIKDSFSAAHNLSGVGGKCEELHGHNYVVELSVGGKELSREGILVDFRELKDSLRRVILGLDHRYLNEVDFFKNRSSSSENIALYIHRSLEPELREKGLSLIEVRVWESDNSCASYREEK